MQIVNLHEMTNPIFLGKITKNISKCRMLIFFTQHVYR